MSRCNFEILLFQEWKEAWSKYEYSPGKIMDQESANEVVQCYHREWLDGCGYDKMTDPDKDPVQEWEERNLGKRTKLGPKAHPLYDAHSIRVQWGEWGLEHITVPGNACGLDISEHGCFGARLGSSSRFLEPHNIDTTSQQVLLLTVFTFFADFVVLEEVRDRLAQARSK